MAEVIAVWGTPASGKTTVAVKLARTLYQTRRKSVILLLTDWHTPGIPVVLPARKEEHFSVGEVLSRVVLSEEDLLSGMNVYQKQENLALLGYTFGENRNTYPPLNHEKVSRFYELLGGMTDYLVVDCESDLSGNLLADMAVRNAGTVFGLLSPDLSSVGYRFSQLPLYPDELFRTNRHTAVLNHPRRDILWAEKEVRTLCPEVGLTLPYSGRLAAQSAEGTLLKETLDPRFEKAIRALAAKVP